MFEEGESAGTLYLSRTNYVVSNTELGICYRDVSVPCLPILPILAADPVPNQAKVAAPGSLFLGEANLFPGALL
jgi:hypothetical protein